MEGRKGLRILPGVFFFFFDVADSWDRECSRHAAYAVKRPVWSPSSVCCFHLLLVCCSSFCIRELVAVRNSPWALQYIHQIRIKTALNVTVVYLALVHGLCRGTIPSTVM